MKKLLFLFASLLFMISLIPINNISSETDVGRPHDDSGIDTLN
ncbi:hypothetical protein QT711_17975 [Sporosarcina saromensis]|uniref:Uncharacterized protein n=1 Tax=Sporosarcina saromensis TaxID=359365 RepID=A0ABU4GDP1_9BACL|nr:hypothetical protein [Sporosarcina saromensis]MDW0115053.1 hypothetical protein [Sporosarcina saromensis]